MSDHFRKLAHTVSSWVGTPAAFAISVFAIIIWAFAGPLFGFSDTWQLVINTSTTIITFLIVFLIQNTQNRDARAIHLKLDELIYATTSARNELIDTEDLSDAELDKLHEHYVEMKKNSEENIDKINELKKKD